MLTCITCGMEFPRNPRGRPRHYCDGCVPSDTRCQRKRAAAKSPSRRPTPSVVIAAWWFAIRRQHADRIIARRITADLLAVLRAPINRQAIYERDGWVCGICLKPVSPGCRWPSPDSPSLDHIVPLAAGGSHEPANVQLAHLRCNEQKGDRPDESPWLEYVRLAYARHAS